MKQQEPQQGEQSQPKQGPGDKLQTARISKGMTLDEVARKMHLSTGILTSLEENNFEDITAPIFVKGYLRAYSRLVNVSEEDIIDEYATYYMDGDPPITSTSNTSPEINAGDSRIKWITYLVIAGIIVLLSAWWWSRYQQQPEKVSLESENQTSSDVIALGSDAGSKAIESAAGMIEPETSSALQQDIKTVVDSLQQPVEQITNDVSETTAIKEKTEDPVEQISQPESTAVVTKSITETEQAAPAVEAVDTENVQQNNPPVDDENLVITVNADTWASIKDATGKKMVYDLLKSGEIISVTGQAPFRAFLGNGYGVSMTYKGKEIDLSKVIKSDNTARINIGQ